MKLYDVISFRSDGCCHCMFSQEIRLEMATKYPVNSYWLKVCTHSFQNCSTMCGNHGNRKLNPYIVYSYFLTTFPWQHLPGSYEIIEQEGLLVC